jgi:hypothetical protein
MILQDQSKSITPTGLANIMPRVSLHDFTKSKTPSGKNGFFRNGLFYIETPFLSHHAARVHPLVKR